MAYNELYQRFSDEQFFVADSASDLTEIGTDHPVGSVTVVLDDTVEWYMLSPSKTWVKFA